MGLFVRIFFATLTLLAQDPQLCENCHKDVTKHSYLHGPLISGNCVSCHTTSAQHFEHPTKQNVSTVAPTNQNCATCHPTIELKSNIHAPVYKEKLCASCHDPHGSSDRRMLKGQARELCVKCHQTVVDKGAREHGFAQNQDRSCVACHDPHSSDNKNLLVQKADELCLSCHNKRIDLVTPNDGGVRAIENIAAKLDAPAHVHSPVSKDGCVKCHTPHGTTNPYMLRENYPKDSYARYEGPKTYQMCMSCHKSKLFDENMGKDVQAMTKFRNDKKNIFGGIERQNLHWYHVVNAADHPDKTRGRSCTICHDAHGSQNTHGVARVWHMSKDPNSLGYNLLLKYEQTTKGGSCTLCHGERKTYERIEK